MQEVVLVSFSELLLNVAQKLVHIRQLQYLLIAHHEHQLELIVQLMEEENIVNDDLSRAYLAALEIWPF